MLFRILCRISYLIARFFYPTHIVSMEVGVIQIIYPFFRCFAVIIIIFDFRPVVFPNTNYQLCSSETESNTIANATSNLIHFFTIILPKKYLSRYQIRYLLPRYSLRCFSYEISLTYRRCTIIELKGICSPCSNISFRY